MLRRSSQDTRRPSNTLRSAFLTALMSAALSLGLPAQTVHPFLSSSGDSLWLRTDNPVSIGVVTMPDRGQTGLSAESTSGDFHRSMESGGVNAWGFSSSGYKSLRPLNLWGSFRFSQERHRDRRWSDNIHPYNGNPYLTGSSVKGKYSYQLFDFSVRMSSRKLFDFIWAGLGVDYSLGDFSRLQDPRSRAQEIDYSIKPGTAFLIGKDKLGLNLSYGYSKEKIGSYISKAKDGKEYLLYLQEGLGVYSTLVSSTYERRIESWKYGVSLQYEHPFGKGSVLLAELSPFYRSDSVEDAYGATPGGYRDVGGKASLSVLSGSWRGWGLFRYSSGSAERVSQKTVTVTDPSSGVTSTRYETIFSIKSYTSETLAGEAGVSYESADAELPTGSKWNAGFKVTFGMSDDEYVYYSPSSSLSLGNLTPSLSGGGALFSAKGHSLTMDGEVAYRMNIFDRLSVSDELKKDVILDNVITPDREIMTSDFVKASADLRYVFPLRSGKMRSSISGFASFSAGVCYAPGFSGSARKIFGLSVGILH